MFKIGDLVYIKRFSEIKKIDKQFNLPVLSSSIAKRYCGKIGKITSVNRDYIDYNRNIITLDIAKDLTWFDSELTKFTYNNFILLQVYLL